jgi:hypothetical protein
MNTDLKQIDERLSRIEMTLNLKQKATAEWLTSADVLQRLNWSYPTFMRWINGRHPNPKYPVPEKVKKVLGRWFIHKSEIDKLFND